MYAVTLLSPAAGEPGETVAAHAGELRINPALPTHDGEQIVGAATPADAIRAALTGTVSVTVGGQSASYPFGRATAGYSAADHKPYFVEVAGTKGRVWLEDLAGLAGSDWDYDDRSWRVSVRQLSGGGGGSGAGGGTVSTLSSAIEQGPFTWTNVFGETASGTYEITEYAPDIWQWQYTVTNNNLSTSSPPPRYGVGSIEIPAAAGVEVFDVEITGDVTDWHADPEYPFWYRDSFTGSYLAPGKTAVLTFKTPPVSILPVTATAPVAARIPSIAEGPAKGPGGPIGDLDIIDSAGNEVIDDKEENPGGWVSVNNDNDNYNFDPADPLSPKADLSEAKKVVEENDLIKIEAIGGLAPGQGAFKLEWSSPKIKVWKSSDKDTEAGKGEVSSGVEIVAAQTTPFWVEGLSLSAAAMAEQIRLTWTPAGGAAQNLDAVNFTVYEVTGVGNVPSYSEHVYKLRTPDTRLSTLSVVGTTGDNRTQTYDESTHTTTRNFLWKEGKVEGVYRATPDAQLPFWADRKVNIVKIAFDFTSPDPNEFKYDPSKMGQITGADSNPLQIFSSTDYNKAPTVHAFEAKIRVVSMEGPRNNRGVRFMETGFVQIVKDANLHGDYQTVSKRITSSLADNKYYIDSLNDASKPWYARATPLYVKGETDDTLLFDPPINLRMTDDPIAVPTNKQFVPNPGQPDDYVDFLSIVMSFETYVCVHTLEAVNDSQRFYTIRADGNWTWNGSGTMTRQADGTLTYKQQQQEPLTGSTKFSEVTDGRIVPIEITEGATANSRLPGTYSDPQPYTP